MYKSKERDPGMPLVKGPFRGIIIKFYKHTDFNAFQSTHSKITFQHPNYYKSSNDKRKCVIYYNNPYDAATIIDKYKENRNFGIYLYIDEISKTLRPDILYIVGKPSQGMKYSLEQLHGTIIKETRVGIQAKFDDFKHAAIAFEEIHKQQSVKFAYKSQVPYIEICHRNPSENHQEIERPGIPKLGLDNKRIENILNEYQKWTPAVKQEFKTALEQFNGSEMKRNLDRIKEAANNLSFADISRSPSVESLKSEISEAWETTATTSEEMLEMHRMYKETYRKKEE